MSARQRAAAAPTCRRNRPTDAVYRVAQLCPRCAGRVLRVRRRPFDRLLSVFVPLQRYRCVSSDCDWCGNLLKRQSSLR